MWLDERRDVVALGRSETELRCNDGWEDSPKDERETLVEVSGDDGRTVVA